MPQIPRFYRHDMTTQIETDNLHRAPHINRLPRFFFMVFWSSQWFTVISWLTGSQWSQVYPSERPPVVRWLIPQHPQLWWSLKWFIDVHSLIFMGRDPSHPLPGSREWAAPQTAAWCIGTCRSRDGVVKSMGKTHQERIGYTETLQKNNEKHV